MNGRPWLEALKGTLREEFIDFEKDPDETPSFHPEQRRKRYESHANKASSVGGRWIAHAMQGEDERRLQTASWTLKERLGELIWQSPDNGFYYSWEIALHSLKNGGTA